MKLLRYGAAGAEKPALVDADGALRDLAGMVDDIGGETLSRDALARLGGLDPTTLPLVAGDPRIGPCVGGVGKFVCIGLNYSDHAAETGSAVPDEPIVFMKATSAIVGPHDDVVMPRDSTKLDWEVELGVVIGTAAKHVSRERALDHVAGFCICNDVSERAFQTERSGQWTKGKSCDTFGPIGPWLVTPDEVGDPQSLGLWLDVDGTRRQDGNTRTMIFDVAHLVAYLSDLFTLYPGDIVSTGTPPGVAMGMKPAPLYLQVGQRMTLGVDGLGSQAQTVVAGTATGSFP